jgi:hypothetical protein
VPAPTEGGDATLVELRKKCAMAVAETLIGWLPHPEVWKEGCDLAAFICVTPEIQLRLVQSGEKTLLWFLLKFADEWLGAVSRWKAAQASKSISGKIAALDNDAKIKLVQNRLSNMSFGRWLVISLKTFSALFAGGFIGGYIGFWFMQILFDATGNNNVVLYENWLQHLRNSFIAAAITGGLWLPFSLLVFLELLL